MATKMLSQSSSSPNKKIYDIPGSGWTSPNWNWGSARGTGHDCAMICRDRYYQKSSRVQLIDKLLNPTSLTFENKDDLEQKKSLLLVQDDPSIRDPPFEEVKLVLGLAWQNGRWDGSDGGSGGYGDILQYMARAERYEGGNDLPKCVECNRQFIQDMSSRFRLIASEDDDQIQGMESIIDNTSDDLDACRRKCAGMVLKAMGFIEKGF